jgi:hypothetical protein
MRDLGLLCLRMTLGGLRPATMTVAWGRAHWGKPIWVTSRAAVSHR